MMETAKNHNLFQTPKKANLASTGFKVHQVENVPNGETLNIANFKGNTHKETVSPFHSKGRRNRTRQTFNFNQMKASRSVKNLEQSSSQIGNNPNAWMSAYCDVGMRTKPMFKNTVGSFKMDSKNKKQIIV
jgi:hypothetical protein